MDKSYPYINSNKKLHEILEAIKSAGEPPKFTVSFLEQMGFKSKNDRPAVNLLKFLGLLGPQGTPTDLYARFRGDESRAVMGKCVQDAYAELFLARPNAPTESATDLTGYFTTASGLGTAAAGRMASTFLALCSVADLDSTLADQAPATEMGQESTTARSSGGGAKPPYAVAVTINLHLPDDPDGYEAIFESLRRQLLR